MDSSPLAMWVAMWVYLTLVTRVSYPSSMSNCYYLKTSLQNELEEEKEGRRVRTEEYLRLGAVLLDCGAPFSPGRWHLCKNCDYQDEV